MLLHCFKVLHAAPLGIVNDLGVVEAAMDISGDEAGDVGRIALSVARLRRSTSCCCLAGFNRGYVDKSDEFVVFADRGHLSHVRLSSLMWMSSN